jgi:hypothetical protein
MMSEKRNTAIGLLVHYMMHAGLPMERDTRKELARLVDSIIEAAAEEVLQSAPMRQLLEQHP